MPKMLVGQGREPISSWTAIAFTHSRVEVGENINGFPMMLRKHDSIIVVVDKLTKVAHFILVKSIYKESDIAQVLMKEFFRLNGLPKAIILDRDVKFTSNFWKGLFQELGT